MMGFGGEGTPPAKHGFGAMPAGGGEKQEQCSCQKGGGTVINNVPVKKEGVTAVVIAVTKK